MGFWNRREFSLGAAYYIAVSLSIIMFAGPLFRSLGFEYSGFIALFASIHLLYFAANESILRRGDSIENILKSLSLPVIILSSIPLAVSFVSALFIPNCSLWDGILFYIEIVYPTALIAMLCGTAFGIAPCSKRNTNIYLTLFWIGTLFMSLLPGYFSAKIYSFGWQYGYFPGFVWDEAMELTSGYWVSRGLGVFLIGSWILLAIRNSGKWQKLVFIFASIISVVVFGIFTSDIFLDKYLAAQIEVAPNVTINLSKGSLTADEIQVVVSDTRRYIEEIRSVYGLKNNSEVQIYLFPTSDELYKYVGTREASISKPWRKSIYITKGNLHSLKHELAHILLAEYGSFPFDINWSTGLTEGAAVAIEDDFDGIRSGDEMAARILQMKLASGVQQVMQFSGFASNASSQSYVLAGSFSHFLIHQYGGEKFINLYSGQDYEEVYQKSLTSLEAEWITSLNSFQTPMDHYDSLRTFFYFKRTSILRQLCLRRIGKLLKNADEAFRDKDYTLADSLYSVAASESGRGRAIQGRVLSLLRLNNFTGALAVIDTSASAQEPNNKTALHLLRGDMIVLATGELQKASAEWEKEMKLELGDSYFMSAFIHRYFFGGAKNIEAVKKALKDIYSIESVKGKHDLLYSIESADSTDYAFALARLYMYSSYFIRTGSLGKALETWKDGLKQLQALRADSSMIGLHLFEKLAGQKYIHYEEIFKDKTLDNNILR